MKTLFHFDPRGRLPIPPEERFFINFTTCAHAAPGNADAVRGNGRGAALRLRAPLCGIALILAFAVARAQEPAHPYTNIAIHVSIVVHNEEDPGYMDVPPLFLNQRDNVVRFAKMLASNEVMMNWQSDWTFLDAALLYDDGTPETDGTNIVAWLDAQGFECDPHAHEKTQNYADVAYRFNLLGVPPSTVVGGFVAAPPSTSKWEHVSGPIESVTYPGYVWTPTLLWGGATAGHVDETNLWASGIWRPADVTNFMRHAENPDALPYIGGFGGKRVRWDNLLRLLTWRAEGRLATGRLYSVSIFYSQNELTNTTVADVDMRIKALSTISNLHWVGLSQLHAIWTNEYGSRANILPYDLTLDNDADGLPDEWEVLHGYDISWTDGKGDADGDGVSDEWEYWADTDPFDPADKPVIALFSAEADQTELRVPCSTNRLYNLEATSNLLEGAWSVVPGQSNLPGDASGSLVFSLTNLAPATYFRSSIGMPE